MDLCKYGNERKIKADKTLGYCGRANVCRCLKEKCSQSGAKIKSRTSEEKAASNKKRRETNLKKYGVENTCQTDIAKEAREKFLADSDLVSDAISKNKATKQRKYGNENYNGSDKARQTNLDRYGVIHPMQLGEYQEKRKQTFLERYDAESPLQSDEIQGKIKHTMLERYGVEYPLQSPAIKAKMINNSINTFCREWATQQNLSDEAYDKLNDVQWLTKQNNEKPMIYISEELGVSDALVGRYFKKHNITPKRYAVSVGEKEVLEFVKTLYDGKILSNVRDIIPGELDIFIPEKQLAIEYNGTYWHSSVHKAKDYHFKKYNECNDCGIQLIQIYEHHWKNSPEIIKSKLISIFKQDTRIFARKCKVIDVTKSEESDFLNKHHIQGKTVSSVRLGLEYNNELVAIMTFLNKRKLGKLETDWELIRYASSATVVGGASRLFSAITNMHDICSVVSYSLNDLHTGCMYERLGFSLSHESGPGYWYVDNKGKQYHRYTFAKHKLVKMGYDINMTESNITASMGLMRFYDSGSKVWSWKR